MIETQMDHATVVVPPHFYADDMEVLDLNIDLVAATAAASESTRIRAVITAPRSLFSKNDPRVVAKRYRIAGATEVDLRLSPLGGQNEGHRKVRSAFDIASGFKTAPLTVTLGLQGNLGQPAVAMEVADRYSVGVGYREQINFKSLIYSQRKERDPNADFPSPNGILLPGPDITLKRKTGRALLSDTKLRGKLGVHTELLANPEADPRGPYLTARNEQFAALQRRPPNWRIQHEYDRLTRAIELREIINDYHLPTDTPRLATRTLRSLLTLCDHYSDRD